MGRASPQAELAATFEKVRMIGQSDLAKGRKLETEIATCRTWSGSSPSTCPRARSGRRARRSTCDESFQARDPARGRLVCHGQGRDQAPRQRQDDAQGDRRARERHVDPKGSQIVVERTYVKKMTSRPASSSTGSGRGPRPPGGQVTLTGKVDGREEEFPERGLGGDQARHGFLQEKLSKRLKDYKVQKTLEAQALGKVAFPTFALLRSGVQRRSSKKPSSSWSRASEGGLLRLALRHVPRGEVGAPRGGPALRPAGAPCALPQGPDPQGRQAGDHKAARSWPSAKHGAGW